MTSKQNRNVSKTVAIEESKICAGMYSGPIPPPDIMNQYRLIDESIPERIMTEFEKNSDHIRERDMLIVEQDYKLKRNGQLFAFFLAVVVLFVVFYSLYLGNTTFAGFSGIAFLGLMATSFLKITTNKNK